MDTLTSFRCECRNGFKLIDRYRCRDINECVEKPYVCTQLCENRPGSYTCKCATGYEKTSADSRVCKIMGEKREAYLLFTNRYYLRNISLTTNNYNLIKDGFHTATGLSYLYNESTLFVADAEASQMIRLRLNESASSVSSEVIIGDQLGGVTGVAVDWIGRKLYYLLSWQMKLVVSDLNGHNRLILLNESVLQEPTSIVVDPFAGYLFFTDWRYPAFIGRVNTDGKNFTKIISEDIGTPIGLSIDIVTKRIWWTDTHLKRIEFSNYDGQNRYIAVGPDRTVFPYALAFYDSLIYWTDRSTESIFAADALNGSNKTTIRDGTIHSAFNLGVYHYSLQPNGTNPCGNNNGGCSHLCLISGGGKNYTCACPNLFFLGTDGKTCQANCTAFHFRCGAPDERCIPFYWRCG